MRELSRLMRKYLQRLVFGSREGWIADRGTSRGCENRAVNAHPARQQKASAGHGGRALRFAPGDKGSSITSRTPHQSHQRGGEPTTQSSAVARPVRSPQCKKNHACLPCDATVAEDHRRVGGVATGFGGVARPRCHSWDATRGPSHGPAQGVSPPISENECQRVEPRKSIQR